ncbi:hypothetical protein BJ170DRAFT_593313 [Xylariales sp. AK1849]|nr:hypothetical protein BJ170DRAFT_593313 [Xylariales sp. AK1849]
MHQGGAKDSSLKALALATAFFSITDLPAIVLDRVHVFLQLLKKLVITIDEIVSMRWIWEPPEHVVLLLFRETLILDRDVDARGNGGIRLCDLTQLVQRNIIS